MSQAHRGLIYLSGLCLAAALLLTAVPATAGGCEEPLLSMAEDGAPVSTLPVAGIERAQVQNDTLLGVWTSSQDPSNGAGLHCHTMTVSAEVAPGRFAVMIDTEYPAGRSLQTCDAFVAGTHISVTCAVSSAVGDGLYSADNFELTMSPNRMFGLNVDDAGTTGVVEFCRR